MESSDLKSINSRFDTMQKWLEEFAYSVKGSFNSVEDRFCAIDQRFEQIDRRFEQVDKRFGQVDKRLDELKEMGYSNGDAIARMIKKMDEEFSAATIRQMRLEERIERIEKAHEFI